MQIDSRALLEQVRVWAHELGFSQIGVAGVDLIRSKRVPLVLEVNSSPGLEGIETATGIDVAGAVVDYVAARQPVQPAAH